MRSEATPPLWDASRVALHAQLQQLSAKLAGVYRRTIVLIEEQPRGGEELVRISLIGHCMRELMNRLPDILKDVPGMLRPAKPNSKTLQKDLLDLLAASGKLNASGPVVSVPGEIIDALQRFAAAVQADSVRAAEKDSVAVTQTRSSTGPAVQQWTMARNFFMDFVHLDAFVGDDAGRLPTDEEILEKLVVVETALRSRLFGFFESRRAIDLRLASINEVIPDAEQP